MSAAAVMDRNRLEQALRQADRAEGPRAAAALLRSELAPWRVVVVDPMDMRGETPAVVGDRCQVYLAATDGHCWSLTTDLERAAGLFLCEKA